MVQDEGAFFLPISSYSDVGKIIQGYQGAGADKEAVRLADVAQATGFYREKISGNNKFLISIGVLDKTAQGFKLTGDGANLALGLGYGETGTEDVRQVWRKLVAQNAFLRRMVEAIRVRGAMGETTFAEHIARATGVPKKQWYMAGARAVIEILVRSGVVERDNGNVKLAEGIEGVEWAELAGMPPVGVTARRPVAEEVGAAPRRVAEIAGVQVQLNLSISVPPDLTEDQAVAFAKSLKRFFANLEESEAGEEQP